MGKNGEKSDEREWERKKLKEKGLEEKGKEKDKDW